MKLFDKLYAIKEEVFEVMQKPGREKMLRRAAERVADELESKKIESESKRIQLERDLVNTKDEDTAIKLFKELARLDTEIETAEALARSVSKERDRLFAEVE
jgi:cell division protein ZapA (FtsZ GTPase activity inhibitor)